MSIFQNKEVPKFEFRSRAEAFHFMLQHLISKGEEPLEASKQADQFAQTFARNMGLPEVVTPPQQGIDKYISYAEKIGNYLETHPKVIEVGIPAITFIVGLFTGKKVEQNNEEEYQTIQKDPKEFINPEDCD